MTEAPYFYGYKQVSEHTSMFTATLLGPIDKVEKTIRIDKVTKELERMSG